MVNDGIISNVAAVAPFVGAWIEIGHNEVYLPRGESLPSWERGLKYRTAWQTDNGRRVAPFVGAWIEIACKL